MAVGVTGSPRLIGVVNPFDADAGTSSSLPFVNVQDVAFGGIFNGVADVGQAIRAAALHLIAIGGGVLFFPPGTYPIYTVGVAYTTLATFANINGIRIIAYGATFAVDPARVFVASLTAFSFTTCTNVSISGVRTTGPSPDRSNVTPLGVEPFLVGKGCTNVSFADCDFQGVTDPIQFIRDPLAGDASITNASLSNINVHDCYYGVTCQFGPDNLTIKGLRTDTVARSFYAYGINGADVQIFSKNPRGADVLLYSYSGYGIQNMKLRYRHDVTTSTSTDGSIKIRLAWGDLTPAIHRNISIDMEVNYAVSGLTGASAFQITKYSDGGVTEDVLDRGHILNRLQLNGYISGLPHYNGFPIVGTNPGCVWGTGDFWSDITLRDLTIENSNVAFFQLGSLTGDLLIENVKSDNAIGLWQTVADQYPPHAGRYKVINSSFPNREVRVLTDGVVQGLEQIRMAGAFTSYAGYSGHLHTNNGAGGVDCNPVNLPPAVAGAQELLYPFLRMDAGLIRILPNGTDVFRGQTVGKLLDINTVGGSVTVVCKITGTWDVAANGAYSFV